MFPTLCNLQGFLLGCGTRPFLMEHLMRLEHTLCVCVCGFGLIISMKLFPFAVMWFNI